LFDPEDRQKEADPALFQVKSFLLRPSVILLIFNGLEWPPETLAGQQWDTHSHPDTASRLK